MTPFGFEVRSRVEFIWSDGTVYKIDRLIDVQNMGSLKTHGNGKRYKVMICNHQRYLYLEDGKWFVEVEEKNLQDEQALK